MHFALCQSTFSSLALCQIFARINLIMHGLFELVNILYRYSNALIVNLVNYLITNS